MYFFLGGLLRLWCFLDLLLLLNFVCFLSSLLLLGLLRAGFPFLLEHQLV